MANPWLRIPLDDYEGHMRAPGVGQLDALGELFGRALEICRPESVAVYGVAGGNGLERIDRAVTRRVVGLDVNPAYLEHARRRFADLPGLELHCIDLAQDAVDLEPVRLVHAALIFEHAGTQRCLENAAAMTAPGGHLSVVLQLASESEPGVGTSPYASIGGLRDEFRLLEPEGLRGLLAARGFDLRHHECRGLPAGKAFWLGIFSR